MKKPPLLAALVLFLLTLLVASPKTLETAAPEGDAPPWVVPGTLDGRFVAIAQDIPGFGGAFIDDDGRLHAVMVDQSRRSEAQERLRLAFVGRGNMDVPVRVSPGQYDFAQLKEWQVRARDLFTIPGVALTDVDERTNRVTIGLHDLGIVGVVEDRLDGLGIPRAAVLIEHVDPTVPQSTLQEAARPVVGGVQITPGATPPCTLGFNAVWEGIRGFLTAAHCSGTVGTNNGMVFFQPTNAPTNRLGEEHFDPPTYPCYPTTQCRLSDALFASFDGGLPASIGYIARPAGEGPANMDIVGNYRIISIADDALMGETLSRVGRTTGLSTGNVTNTCVDITLGGILYICQQQVAAANDAGDSGSPVFKITNSPNLHDVRLYGLHHAGNGMTYTFSPMANINLEFGGIAAVSNVGGIAEVPVIVSDAASTSDHLGGRTPTSVAFAAALASLVAIAAYVALRMRTRI